AWEAQRLVAGLVGVRALGRADGPRVVDRGVRVGERRVLDVAVDEALALLPVGDDLELDARPVLLVPLLHRLVVGDDRLVLPGVELDVEDVGRLAFAHAARDAGRLAGGELPVHRRRRDADALLATRVVAGDRAFAGDEVLASKDGKVVDERVPGSDLGHVDDA